MSVFALLEVVIDQVIMDHLVNHCFHKLLFGKVIEITEPYAPFSNGPFSLCGNPNERGRVFPCVYDFKWRDRQDALVFEVFFPTVDV